MKAVEIIRILSLMVLGFVLMFLGQPWFYQARIFFISDQPVEDWLGDSYTPAAWLVFSVCLITTLMWYFLGAKAKISGGYETNRWKVIWGLLGLAPILSIIGAIGFFNTSQDALISFTSFLLLDALCLFWLPTVTSSPEPVKYVPFGAFLVRRSIDSWRS